MKAWQCDDSWPVPGLFQANIEPPRPARGELLIRVHAAGVTPTELQWFPTTHTKSGAPRAHAIPGHEFSGVVAATGEEANFTVGQQVFGLNDWFADGATAEFCCTLPSHVAPKPARLTHAEAASVPIGALTAWQGLLDRAKLQSGERILIHAKTRPRKNGRDVGSAELAGSRRTTFSRATGGEPQFRCSHNRDRGGPQGPALSRFGAKRRNGQTTACGSASRRLDCSEAGPRWAGLL
jgi:hypothetical protein